MLNTLKEIYAEHDWLKFVASLGLLLCGIGLFWLSGGFPPWAWRFLFQVLPRLPALWTHQGSATLLPLLGLIALSLTILLLWVIIIGLEIQIISRWWQDHQTSTLEPYSEDLAEGASEFHDEEEERPTRPPVRPPARSSREPDDYPRRKQETLTSMPTRPDKDSHKGRPQSQPRSQARPQPQLQSLQAQPPEPEVTQPVQKQRQITLPPTNYATRPLTTGQTLPPSNERRQSAPLKNQPERRPINIDEIKHKQANTSKPGRKQVDTTRPGRSSANTGQPEPRQLDTALPTPVRRVANTSEPGHKPARQKAPDTDQLAPKNNLIQLVSGSCLDPGKARKGKPNEDSLLAFQGTHTTTDEFQPFGLFIIADGMGGHVNGKEASQTAIKEVSNIVVASLLQSEARAGAFADLLAKGVQQANRQLFQRNRKQEELMGTTLTAALIVGRTAYIANVGDSRTYLYRSGEGLKQITRDHSIVARFVELGNITPEEVYTHPLRNQIYRCLGEQAAVQVDSFTTQLQGGDKLLLCSDGLWEMIHDKGIQQIFSKAPPNPNKTCEQLVQAALDKGGDDNISAIVVYVQSTASTNLPALKARVWPLEEGVDAM